MAAWMVVPFAAANAAQVYVECESFERTGGWVVESQSTRQIGSSYLMAHGMGVPVADAETVVEFKEGGRYCVWAKTRNWNAVWTSGAAGRFLMTMRRDGEGAAATLKRDGEGAAATTEWRSGELGAEGVKWHWQRAGEVELKPGRYRVALHDLTGFNGRCDAVCFTTAAEVPTVGPAVPAPVDDAQLYDLAVVGGGVSGSCVALTAARYGLKVLVLQDREVLGGCNSSEVRVGMGGRIHTGHYPNLGHVVKEIQPLLSSGSPLPGDKYEDDRKKSAFDAWKFVGWATPGVKPQLKFRQYVYAVEKDPSATNRLVAVLARDTHSGVVTRYRAKLFVDATGDATIARLAGCEVMYGREPRARFNEISAPAEGDRRVMGQSVQWLAEMKREPTAFPDISAWALAIDDASGSYQMRGSWEQETGFFRDMADDVETIRDYGLLAIFSNWHWMKNKSAKKSAYANAAFTWISPIGGKRESYRVVGDYVLNQNDLENHVQHPDFTAEITWGIDFHFPDPRNADKFKEPFRAAAYHRGTGDEYPVPYRCLYARDCANLFLAGRDISCSHCAFAAVRVMRTLGMLGEVVGMAAKICRDNNCLPRDVYAKHLDALKALMAKGVPQLPDYHGYHVGYGESYDFNHRGWAHVYPNAKPIPKGHLEDIRRMGYIHRNEHPDLQDRRRRFVLADESRGKLHLYDSKSPARGYSVDVKKPVWDLKRLDRDHYRTIFHGGFQIVNMGTQKVESEFTCPNLNGGSVTACCDLPDGGFVLSVNPKDGKAIHFHEFGADRRPRRVLKLEGYFNARTMSVGRNGELLVAHERGFARVRLPESGEAMTLVKDYPTPTRRNVFSAEPDRAGTGYWVGSGYGAELVHVAEDGKELSAWRAEQGGKRNVFYGQVAETTNNTVYVANWTGHGAEDSFNGWQMIEFDADGKVVWRLDSPDRYGSISGFIILRTDIP